MADVNILTQVGEEWIVDQLDAVAGGRYIAFGTGGTTAAKGDVALGAEHGRILAVESQFAADKLRWIGGPLTSDGGNLSINEAGLFTASVSGTMVLSCTFTAFTITEDDLVTFTFDLEVT